MSDLLTTKQLAEELRFCEETIRRMVRAAKIPVMRASGTSGRMLFERDAVLRALQVSPQSTPTTGCGPRDGVNF